MIATIIFSLLGGVILGLVYFSALWLTVRQVTTSRFAPLLVLLSLIFRLAILGAGLYLIGGRQPLRYVAALGGVIIVRVVFTHRIKLLTAQSAQKLPPESQA